MSEKDASENINFKRQVEEELDTQEDFELDQLRRSKDFDSEGLGVETVTTEIPVRKPKSQEFFKAHPDLSMKTAILEVEMEGVEGKYILTQDMQTHPELVQEVRPATLVPLITRQEVLILYPVKSPKPGESSNSWWDSAAKIIERAKKDWVRMYADMNVGAYQMKVATAENEEPNWPDMDMEEIVRKAFDGKIISSDNHEVVKRLRGEEI